MTTPRTQHQGNSRHALIVPYRIGLLLDHKDPAHRDLQDALALGLEEIRLTGELDREVIIEVRESVGAPGGSVLDTLAHWRELNADQTLMAVVGPFDDDNGAALTEDIEAVGLPTLTYSASDAYAGRYVFQLPLGHTTDAMHRLLRHARESGSSRVALVRETGHRGARIERSFQIASWQQRLERVEVFERNSTLSGLLRGVQADAVIYIGGHEHAAVRQAVEAAGLKALLLTGIEITRAHPIHGDAATLEGWTGLAATDPNNHTFRNFVHAFAERHGRSADHVLAALGYDMGRLLGAVLAVVRPPSPQGVRVGLDRMRMVLAATGRAGTVISFAPYDHRGFKGDPFILARVRDGELEPLPDHAARVR